MTEAAKTAPDYATLMKGVIPYIVVAGAEKAAAFYARAFGAIQHMPAARDESGTVMNVGLEINGGWMMLMDVMPDIGAEGMACTNQGITMQIVTDQGDFWWNRAVEAGCTVTHPFQREFWGDRYGRVIDPFGIAWAVNEPARQP